MNTSIDENQVNVDDEINQTINRDLFQSNKNLKKHIRQCMKHPEKRNQIINGDNNNQLIKLQQYKNEALTYKQQLKICQKTINHLRTTIHLIEELEQLKITEQEPGQQYETTHTDYKINSHEINHFTCRCTDRINPNHKPSYQYCLKIFEQYQTLFDIDCFKQISTSLTDLYHNYQEINTLKKSTKIKDTNQAIEKIHTYDNPVPYYHQIIEQIIKLLELSKSDQIIPAIKTLLLLAHTDIQY
ncbi:unnamed protein product [Adineta steineri]|uniref:Uncharacterized protein n=1 Tax=Adineta steineri TaxID=433720 RepID=A0A819R3L2_9BILA|nr:unnamed protein product [Adineta steineri]CAF4039415.1 unnamed protein product [Adineta steineri]